MYKNVQEGHPYLDTLKTISLVCKTLLLECPNKDVPLGRFY